jgi:hypothetical protein
VWNGISEFTSVPLVARNVGACEYAVALQMVGVAPRYRGVDLEGGMSSTISGRCWMCMQVGLSLDLVRLEDQRCFVSGVPVSLDDSHFGCWHVMFASCCVSGAEDFDTSICTFPMVIRKRSSVRSNYWSEDQQVNLFDTKFVFVFVLGTILFRLGRI